MKKILPITQFFQQMELFLKTECEKLLRGLSYGTYKRRYKRKKRLSKKRNKPSNPREKKNKENKT